MEVTNKPSKSTFFSRLLIATWQNKSKQDSKNKLTKTEITYLTTKHTDNLQRLFSPFYQTESFVMTGSRIMELARSKSYKYKNWVGNELDAHSVKRVGSF